MNRFLPGRSLSIPADLELEKTLARRVQQLREFRGWTPERLSFEAKLPLKMIQEIESGLEAFLSVGTRQKLARVLRVKPSVLAEVEFQPPNETPYLSLSESQQWVEALWRNPNGEHHCPSCGSPVQARFFQRETLDGKALTSVKANCTQCLFRYND